MPNVTVFSALKEDLTFIEIIDLEVVVDEELELLEFTVSLLEFVVESLIVLLVVLLELIDVPSELFTDSDLLSPVFVEVDVFVPSEVEVESTTELFVPLDVELLLTVEDPLEFENEVVFELVKLLELLFDDELPLERELVLEFELELPDEEPLDEVVVVPLDVADEALLPFVILFPTFCLVNVVLLSRVTVSTVLKGSLGSGIASTVVLELLVPVPPLIISVPVISTVCSITP